MFRPVQAGLFLARLRTLKYFPSTSGGGVAWRSEGMLSVLFGLRLVRRQKELRQRLGASECEYYLPYRDFSGTTPAHISPRHSQTYIYAWVTGTRRQ